LGGDVPRHAADSRVVALELRADPQLVLASTTYLADLLRELELVRRAAGHTGPVSQLLEQVEARLHGAAAAFSSVGALAAQAWQRGDSEIRVVLPHEAVEACAELLEVLGAIDYLSGEGHLLTLPPPRAALRLQEQWLRAVVGASPAESPPEWAVPSALRGASAEGGENHRLVLADVGAPATRFVRRELRELLERWGLRELADEAELAATELIANAELHGDGAREVAFRRLDAGVRIEVSDGSPVPPAMRACDGDSATGRGLAMVEAVTDSWGVEARGNGKVVWCEVSASAGRSREARARDEASLR
jgi:anti-sigma regulatory factor (Ser/Thr protein kinase)